MQEIIDLDLLDSWLEALKLSFMFRPKKHLVFTFLLARNENEKVETSRDSKIAHIFSWKWEFGRLKTSLNCLFWQKQTFFLEYGNTYFAIRKSVVVAKRGLDYYSQSCKDRHVTRRSLIEPIWKAKGTVDGKKTLLRSNWY